MTLYVETNGARPFNIEIGGMGGPMCCLCCRLLGVIYFANTGVKVRVLWGEFRRHGASPVMVFLLLLLMSFAQLLHLENTGVG